jgi:hypothetical protein
MTKSHADHPNFDWLEYTGTSAQNFAKDFNKSGKIFQILYVSDVLLQIFKNFCALTGTIAQVFINGRCLTIEAIYL